MSRPARVPWHRSLFVRLFGLGAVIALLAVGAATWATVHATSVAVRQEQRESLHADARTYDALVGYAATHRTWTDAGPLVRRLAEQYGGRVAVTDTAGRVLVTSGSGGASGTLPVGQARARIDPLDVDTALYVAGGSTAAPAEASPAPAIDAAATGARCTGASVPSQCVELVVRPTLALDPRVAGPFTGSARAAAYTQLRQAVDACLARADLDPLLAVRTDLSVVAATPQHHRRVAACLDQTLRTTLTPYVAPAALLHLSGSGSTAEVLWDLSGPTQLRIGLLAGGVLLVTLLLSALLAVTLVRPLRRMAVAAARAGDGDLGVRVPARRRDEVGEVARAFNTMADRRQSLEQARRRMVSDVSHELRTPLANLRGWLEAARDGLAAPDPALLDSLLEESLHLQRLVDDLHDLSVGDAGELRLAPEPVDLGVFLGQVRTSFGAAAEDARVGLEVAVEPGTTAYADPVRLRQAVANLVANALRHTPAGGTVTLHGRPGVVEVTDTGDGIPADELPHVFDRFRRVDPSRSRATGGSGLGLAIVRQIAEAHGGTAAITSTLGRGTTVTLTLPPAPR